MHDAATFCVVDFIRKKLDILSLILDDVRVNIRVYAQRKKGIQPKVKYTSLFYLSFLFYCVSFSFHFIRF